MHMCRYLYMSTLPSLWGSGPGGLNVATDDRKRLDTLDVVYLGCFLERSSLKEKRK